MSTMMNRRGLVSQLFGFGLAVLAVECFIAPAHATVLTFDLRDTSDVYTNAQYITNANAFNYNTAGYGSNVTASDLATFQTRPSYHNYYGSAGGATPNIALNWTTVANNFYVYDFGTWAKAAISNGPNVSRNMGITFTPDAGFGVDLTSFTLHKYQFADGLYHTAGTWEVRDTNSGGTLLASNNWTNTASLDTVSINYTGAIGQTLFFRYTVSANVDPYNDSLGFDNLRFGQITATPEPTSFALLLFGMGTFLTMRRKRTVVLRALSARSGKVTSVLCLVLALVILGGFITPAYATVLTFDLRDTSDVYTNTKFITNADAFNYNTAGYGSNVTASDLATFQTKPSYHNYYGSAGGATPNIALNWTAATNAFYVFEFGTWAKAAISNGPNVSRNMGITFTPDAGFGVDLTSFTLQKYQFADGLYHTAGTWEVRDTNSGGTLLASNNWTNTVALDTISINYSGAIGQTLFFRYTVNANADPYNDSLGFDNLRFSQSAVPTPEPNSLTLALFSFVALLKIRRRPMV